MVDKAPDPDDEVGDDDKGGIDEIGEGEDDAKKLTMDKEEGETAGDDEKIEELSERSDDAVGPIASEVQGVGTDDNQNQKRGGNGTDRSLAALGSEKKEEVETD